MIQNYVLTLIGDDRPGLVDSLAEVVKNHGGNWLESRLANLAGKFSGIVLVAIPQENKDAFLTATTRLKNSGLSVRATKASKEAGKEPNKANREDRHTESMTILANDRSGILNEVTSVLAELKVNVEELTTDCQPAPMSSEMLFRASAKISVPDSLSDDQLSLALEALADDLVVELEAAS